MSEAVHQTSAPNPGSGQMFDQIAGRYDLLNRLMSMGIDQSWRRKTVAAMELPPSALVLDLATGTADLAMMIARIHPDAQVIGSDPSARMLEVGHDKALTLVKHTGRHQRADGPDAQSARPHVDRDDHPPGRESCDRRHGS